MPEGKTNHVTFRCEDDQLIRLKEMRMGTRSAYIREAIDFFEKKEDQSNVSLKMDSLVLRLEMKLDAILQKLEQRADTNSGFILIDDGSAETTRFAPINPLKTDGNDRSESQIETQELAPSDADVMYLLGY